MKMAELLPLREYLFILKLFLLRCSSILEVRVSFSHHFYQADNFIRMVTASLKGEPE